MSDPILRRTPLYDRLLHLNARMTEFGGWEMPVQFHGLIQEHQAVRTQAGLFDISHMGKFVLQGQGILEQLQGLVPSDLSHLQPGQAQYTLLLNEQGGILDDLIIYPQGIQNNAESVVIIVNAATCAKDKAWLLQYLDSKRVELQDWTENYVLVALQGPKAAALFQPFLEPNLSQIPRFGHVQSQWQGHPTFIARTGYTGEDGFEILVPSQAGGSLWQLLLEAGAIPCGLGARDTLRLEAAMNLYGQDMDETTTPLESGLGWVVHWDRKGEFVGRSALEQQKEAGVPRRLVGLQMEGRNIARQGYPVLAEGRPVGVVTSGSWAPSLQYPIALARLETAFSKIGQPLAVEIRGKTWPATVVKRPFYRSQ